MSDELRALVAKWRQEATESLDKTMGLIPGRGDIYLTEAAYR